MRDWSYRYLKYPINGMIDVQEVTRIATHKDLDLIGNVLDNVGWVSHDIDDTLDHTEEEMLEMVRGAVKTVGEALKGYEYPVAFIVLEKENVELMLSVCDDNDDPSDIHDAIRVFDELGLGDLIRVPGSS